MKTELFVFVTIALILGMIVGVVFHKYIWSDYFHVHTITAENLLESVTAKSVKYEKKRVEFLVKMKRRGFPTTIMGEVGDRNITWYIETDEDRRNEWYKEGESYRFKLYIRRIDYIQSDDQYLIWSKIIK